MSFNRWFNGLGPTAFLLLTLNTLPNFAADDGTLHLNLRRRASAVGGAEKASALSVKRTDWDARKTAIIVIDMWDDHWCKGAARRVVEMAGPMNEVLKTARAKGVFIIHSPSSVTRFYAGTSQRKRAQEAAFAKTKTPLTQAERWGTAWHWPDPAVEPELPIDDSDMGCDCAVKCEIREAWTRQIATLEIADADAITDDPQEAHNLLEQRGIQNVIYMGVHLNMCVLGRGCAIRQMVKLGKNVALVRDLTDTMYNHEKRPQVNHFQGTDLVIEHVEKFWCPTFASSDLTGKAPFRFKEDPRPASAR